MRRSLATTTRPVLLAGLLAAGALPALAQTTPEETARLQAVGEAYFGKGTAEAPSAVKVVAEGDHYRASLDVALLVRRLLALLPAEDAKKVTLDWAAPSMALAPQGGGLWRFWDYHIPDLTLDIDGQRTTMKVEGTDFEVVTDPVTGVTPKMAGRFARIAAASTIRKAGEPFSVTSEDISSAIEMRGDAKATALPGVVDVALSQNSTSMLYSLEIAEGRAAGVPDVKMTLGGGKRDSATTLTGLRHTALLDLWAHLVAHHAPEDFTTGQSALKARIAAAMPLFQAVTYRATGADFAFESPFGIAKAAKAGIDLDLAGMIRDGRFGLAVAVSGFQAYSLFMPKWGQKLVPTDLALAGRVTGYDVATPTSLFLDGADFTAKKPLTDDQEARIAAAFLPSGAAEIVLDGNRLTGPLYDLTLDGRMTAGPKGAKGAVTVRARGVEKVAEHLAGFPDDEQAKSIAGVVAVARTFAERKGDDLVWRFDFDGDHVSVNGKPLK